MHIRAWITGPIVVLAMLLYLQVFVQVAAQKRLKNSLRDHARKFVAGNHTLHPFPKNMYYFVMSPEGVVKEHSKDKHTVGLNLKENIYFAPVYKKIVSRGELGGGYTLFKWQQEGRLKTHLAFSLKKDGGDVLCMCNQMK